MKARTTVPKQKEGRISCRCKAFSIVLRSNGLLSVPRSTVITCSSSSQHVRRFLFQCREIFQEAVRQDIVPLLKKGALVAQDPSDFERITELDGVEHDELCNESLTNEAK